MQDSNADLQATMPTAHNEYYAKIERQAQQATLINHIVKAMRSTLVLDDALQTTVEQLQSALNASHCLIFLLDCHKQPATYHVSPATATGESPYSDLYSYYHQILAMGETVVIPKKHLPASESEMYSILLVPLLYEQTYLGVISLAQAGEWRKDDLSFVKDIAAHCAIAIHHCQLYQQAKTAITQSQHKEEILLQATFELQALFQVFPDLYFRLDADGTILNYHTGRTSDLSLLPEEFLNKRVQDVLPPVVGHQFHAALLQVLQTNSSVTVDYTLLVPSGKKTFEARLLPLSENQIVVISRDITDSLQAIEALRESEERFRRLCEATFEGIAINVDNSIIDANQALAEMSGYEISDIIGMNPLELIAVDARDLVLQHILSEDETPYESLALTK